MEQKLKKAEIEYARDFDNLDCMLQEAYPKAGVPAEANIRLRNQIKCREVMGESKISFWWLPATVSTVFSVALGIIFIAIYCLIEIKGANCLMPNLLSHISTFWLKVSLLFLTAETAVSWLVTFIGLWKGSFHKYAKYLN